MNNSNPRAILVLSYSYRNVAVFRDQCDSYEVSRPCCFHPHTPRLSTLLVAFLTVGLITTMPQGLLTLARSTFPAVQKAPAEDIVVQGCHPHYPTMGTSIEMSKEIWEACCARVTHVTFVVRSGASPMVPDEDDAVVIDGDISSEKPESVG